MYGMANYSKQEQYKIKYLKRTIITKWPLDHWLLQLTSVGVLLCSVKQIRSRTIHFLNTRLATQLYVSSPVRSTSLDSMTMRNSQVEQSTLKTSKRMYENCINVEQQCAGLLESTNQVLPIAASAIHIYILHEMLFFIKHAHRTHSGT